MKRTPLVRRTPLQSRTELRSRIELRRGGPLNPVSARRKRDNMERRRVVSAMRAAARGECARCGRRALEVHGHERHRGSRRHRWFMRPDCLLCNECNGWAATEPQKAAWTGWAVSPKWPHDPSLAPTQALALNGSVVEFEVVDEFGEAS